MIDLEKIKINFKEKLNSTKNKEDLQNLKTEFLEKTGLCQSNLKKWDV